MDDKITGSIDYASLTVKHKLDENNELLARRDTEGNATGELVHKFNKDTSISIQQKNKNTTNIEVTIEI